MQLLGLRKQIRAETKIRKESVLRGKNFISFAISTLVHAMIATEAYMFISLEVYALVLHTICKILTK